MLFGYDIYCVNPKSNFAFFRYETAKKYGWKFNTENYTREYAGVINRDNDSVSGCLEELFETFNLRSPLDYTGHSMSVSDIVALRREDEEEFKYYFCDSFGFVDITDQIENAN